MPTLVAVRSVWDVQADGMTEQDRREPDRLSDRYRDLIRLMRDAGVPILAGTDQAPDGASLHRELELLAEAGLSPAEAIAAATSRAAAFLRPPRHHARLPALSRPLTDLQRVAENTPTVKTP